MLPPKHKNQHRQQQLRHQHPSLTKRALWTDVPSELGPGHHRRRTMTTHTKHLLYSKQLRPQQQQQWRPLGRWPLRQCPKQQQFQTDVLLELGPGQDRRKLKPIHTKHLLYSKQWRIRQQQQQQQNHVLVSVCVVTPTCPSFGLHSRANHKVHAHKLYNDSYWWWNRTPHSKDCWPTSARFYYRLTAAHCTTSIRRGTKCWNSCRYLEQNKSPWSYYFRWRTKTFAMGTHSS